VEPALFLGEIQEKLHMVWDVKVSISTLSHTLNHLVITHKAVAKEVMEWNKHLCATWQVIMGQYDTCQLVFVDEAGVDDHTNIPKNGGAPLGQACVHWMTFLQGWKYSILPTLSCDEILALNIFEGSVNHECFINFLCNHLVCLFFKL
jgi:hypothetical protein